MAGRVAWHVQHGESMTADADLLAFVQPAIGRHGARLGQAEAAALLGEALQQEQILTSRPLDRHRPALRGRQGGAQFVGAAGMVDMAVRQQDLLRRHAQLGQRFLDPAHVAAGINHRAEAGFLVPQDGAVLLERRDRDDGDLQFGHAHGLRG